MQRDHRVHALQRAIADHQRRAAHLLVADGLLGGLEQEAHLAAQPACRELLLEQVRHAQQHGRVAIVAAGVHIAVRLRAIGCVVGLDDRQRVHIGADGDRWPIAVAQLANDAGDADAGAHLDAADLAQRVGDQRRGAHFLEGQLGVAVDLAPQANQLVR